MRKSTLKRSRMTPEKDRVGRLLVMGANEAGQLGIGDNFLGTDIVKPRAVKENLPENIIDTVCGAMHTIALDSQGVIWSWGCNDDGQLGRSTEDIDEALPGAVELSEKVVKVSAGDNHTAVLTESGRVFVWGVFKDISGIIGLTTAVQKSDKPIQLLISQSIVSICSGENHLVMLTDTGKIYTIGCAVSGVLGRVREGFTSGEAMRNGNTDFLTPAEVRVRPAAGRRGTGGDSRSRRPVFSRIWCAAYSVFAETTAAEVYAWGLNNSSQLGKPFDGEQPSVYFPERIDTLTSHGRPWTKILPGLKHTIGLDADGRVYTWGSRHYGALGHGDVEVTTEHRRSDSGAVKRRSDGVDLTPAKKAKPEQADSGTASLGTATPTHDESGNPPTAASVDDEASPGNMALLKSAVHKISNQMLNGGDEAAVRREIQQLPRHCDALAGRAVDVALGGSCSFAVDDKGVLYSWGMESPMLGQGDDLEGDIWVPTPVVDKKFEARKVFQISAGSQHCSFLLDMCGTVAKSAAKS